jgi:exonuclease VII small subunit
MFKPLKSVIILAVVPCMIAATMPVGSLSSSGDSTVSGVSVPSGTAVFPGDLISTSKSGAVLNLSQGGTIQLGLDSQVRMPSNPAKGIEIVKGLSRVQSKSREVVLSASDWHLQGQPNAKTGQFTADVLRESDGRVSLNVSSGDIVAHSNQGNVTLMAQVGHPLMLPASMPDPTPTPTPTPQGGGSGSGSGSSGSGVSKGTVWALAALGVAGVAIGAAALASRPPDESSAVASLSSQVSSLSSQITALNSQVASLQTSLTAAIASATALQSAAALVNQLNAQLAILNAAQAALNSAQATINADVIILAAGGTLTATQQAALTAAQATVTAQAAIIAGATTSAASLISQLNKITVPSPHVGPA